MAQHVSPLRYPGGKSCLLELTSAILRENKANRREYAEPFAGGCGLALNLLFGGHVSDIHINDIDPGIWAFWHSVLNQTDELAELIETTPITIEEWFQQREVIKDPREHDFLTLGFSTFFLNRTNRSGIIKGAGAIGGIAQNGNYKLDCRFNRSDLIERIKRIKKYRDRIHLSNFDAIEFLENRNQEIPSSTFFCIDPPYFKKGASLYTSFYKAEDHALLADTVMNLKHPYIVTYDNAEEIRKLYLRRRQFCFDINYSVQTKRVGTELLIPSKGLRMPSIIRERQINRPNYKAA